MKRVYTFELEVPAVVERQCKKLGWPNRDTTGATMFENTHFKTWREAHEHLIVNLDAAMSLTADDYTTAKKRLVEYTERLARYSSLAVAARRLEEPQASGVDGGEVDDARE